MAEWRPSITFLQELGFPGRATNCIDIARGFVPPCKRSTTRICDLMDYVTDCNKALWCLGLQIRDDPRDELGEASVAVIRRIRRKFLGAVLESDPGLTALAVLIFLFVEHRCIVAVEMFDVVAKNRAVLFSLQKIRTLKRLRIVVDPDEQPDGVDSLVAFVQSVVVTGGAQLRFISGDYSLDYQRSLLHNLLGHKESKLTALDLTGLTTTTNRAKTLVSALGKNNSVTELAVGSLIFGPNRRERFEHFVTYLGKKKATLRKLRFDASGVNEGQSLDLMRILVQAICEMTSLEELTAYWLCKAVDIGLIGSVLKSNKSLRSLEVQCRHCCDLWAHQSDSPIHEVTVIEPWASGLKTNHTLERLTIDLSLYTAYECCLLIDAIAVNVSIVTVTVRNIADNGCLHAVYARMRDRKIQHRVVVEDHHVGLKDVKELSLFPEASVVTLSSWHFAQPPALCTAIQELAACSHITALRLRFMYYDKTLYTAAANYIEATVTVRDIELYVSDLHEASDSHVATHYRLIEALALNQGVSKLKLNLKHLSDRCCDLVADSILQNLMLYELSLEALDERSCAKFLRRLLPGLAQNYSLLVARLPDFGLPLEAEMATLHDVTRRNRRLVDLASRFVTGEDRDSSTKSALSLVAQHPKLLETVAQKKGVTEIEAMSMIEQSRPLPPFSEVRSCS